MPARHEHAAIPLVARQRDELGERRQRFGRDADVGVAVRGVLGDLDGIALVQLDLHARKARGEIAHDRRQHVARLRVRGRDGERALVLVPELGSHAADVLDLPQRAARGGDHRFAGRRDRRDALAGANEDADAELVLELAHLLAHARLRREQRCGGVRHVEAVVGDRAEIAQLLKVQGNGTVG